MGVLDGGGYCRREGTVLGVLRHPIVTIGVFLTQLFSNYFEDLFVIVHNLWENGCYIFGRLIYSRHVVLMYVSCHYVQLDHVHSASECSVHAE